MEGTERALNQMLMSNLTQNLIVKWYKSWCFSFNKLGHLQHAVEELAPILSTPFVAHPLLRHFLAAGAGPWHWLSSMSQVIWYHLYAESNIWQKWNFPQKRNSCTWRTDLLLLGGGGGSGMDWESGDNRCKLLLLEWINNDILLYSTGNYIQSLVMKHDGG